MSDERGYAKGFPAGCARCAELAAQLEAVFGMDECPKCGVGIVATCLGCQVKAERERKKALAEALRRLIEAVEREYGEQPGVPELVAAKALLK